MSPVLGGGAAGLAGGGAAGELIRRIEWSATRLGAIERWPSSLKMAIGIVLHSRQPMFLWWGSELIQFYNDAYTPSFGVGKHPRAMGQRGRDCWGEIWHIISPQIEAVMTRGEASWNEDRLVPIFRNGRLEEVYWTYGYSPVFDDDGSVGGTLVVCTETTARVLATRRLRILSDLAESTTLATDAASVDRIAMQALGRAVYDIPFAFMCLAQYADGQVRVTETVGVSEAQAVGLATRIGQHSLSEEGDESRTLAMPGPPVHAGRWPEPVSELFIDTLRDAAGGTRGKLVVGISPRLGFDALYREFLTQIKERIQLALARANAFRARAIAESERNNLLLQAPVPTAILTGPDHVYRLANKPYLRMVNRKDFTGKSFLEAFPELTGTSLPAALDEVFRTGKPFVAQDSPVILQDEETGESIEGFFNYSLEPLRDPSGEVYGMIAMGIETTEQVRSRRVLERTNQERETLLLHLEEASRAKDEFLAMLGHELRNPLSPITTALELMKLRQGGQASHEQAVIERQVKHLTRLVDDLLDVAKITRGKVELKHEVLELSEVLARAVEIASFLFEQRKHRLTVDAPRVGLKLRADPVRLAQVVANLLINAARYTDLGGVIALSARREGEQVVITVQDNGSGISADMLNSVFEPFVQGKRTKERAEGGLGLGLALVKNLISLHGGEVAAHSDGPGRGSTFSIRLPALPEGKELENVSAQPLAREAAVGRRVLVVDDNADAADLLDTLLQAVGHRVRTAHSPLEALDLVADGAPEVAILDIGLPVMDGYELGLRIRARAPSCRLIALTGYGQGDDHARSAAAGFHAHFVKPVAMEELLAAIAE